MQIFKNLHKMVCEKSNKISQVLFTYIQYIYIFMQMKLLFSRFQTRLILGTEFDKKGRKMKMRITRLIFQKASAFVAEWISEDLIVFDGMFSGYFITLMTSFARSLRKSQKQLELASFWYNFQVLPLKTQKTFKQKLASFWINYRKLTSFLNKLQKAYTFSEQITESL